jgi:putative endonuclease
LGRIAVYLTLKMGEIQSIISNESTTAGLGTARVGRIGEELAARYLEANGYRLIVSNFKVPVGRNSRGVQATGEIDIIALDGDTLCFIEVKTRRSAEFAAPIANVDLRKQRQITRTARVYQRIFRVGGLQRRFDVVSVVLGKRGEPTIELVKGFWSESKFRKRKWLDEDFY